VLNQSLADWELLVVGDACTDDTEQVVASFADARIHFFNLERNVGEQSGPNSEGFRRSRGSLIAYLGQDDLWFPDHLERCVQALADAEVDFVFTLADEIRPDGGRTLIGATPTGRFEPWLRTVPSTWVLRRELLERVGPWRPAVELHASPQEDFLTRIHRLRIEMRLVPVVTVLKITSADRPGIYATRDASENEHFWRLVRDEPSFREQELTLLALDHAGREGRPDGIRVHLDSAARDTAKRLTVALGVSPYAFYNVVRFRRKGAFLDHLRRGRGLGPIQRGD
jgi:glycosyltransferase involved in cell wall biosynthesis